MECAKSEYLSVTGEKFVSGSTNFDCVIKKVRKKLAIDTYKKRPHRTNIVINSLCLPPDCLSNRRERANKNEWCDDNSISYNLLRD